MGDMADDAIDRMAWPDFDDPVWDEGEGSEAPEQPQYPRRAEPIHVQPGSKPMNLKSLVYDTEAVIAQLADLKDGEMDEDGDFEEVMHFLVPALLENRPNDLVRILWDRANKRAEQAFNANPVREFQFLLQEFNLSLTRTP